METEENKPETTEKLKLRMLIIDDQPDDIRPLKEAMLFEGHEVTMAEDLKEAFEILFKGGIDSVIVDLSMSKASGIFLFRWMLPYPELHEPSYIVYSVYNGIDSFYDFPRLDVKELTKHLRGGFHQLVKPGDTGRMIEWFTDDLNKAIARLGRRPGDYAPLTPTEETLRHLSCIGSPPPIRDVVPPPKKPKPTFWQKIKQTFRNPQKNH